MRLPCGRCRLPSRAFRASSSRIWTFDYRSGHTIVTDVFGRTTEYGFDHNREHIYTIDADGRRTDTERDDYGRIILQRDPLGRETRYLYDTYGNLLAVTAPDGSRTAIGYEDENNDSLPTEITQPDGSLTRYEYDADGNLIAETDALGHTTRYTYDRRGLPVGITDPLGKSKTLVYDAAGQLTAYTDCSGQTTRFTYTALGEIETVTDALNQTTRYDYDEYGNHIRTDHPDGGSEHFVYDALNRLTGHTDPLGGQTRYTLDKDGLPKERTDALGNRFSYTYDTARRLTRLTNENGEHYLLDYDNADRLVRETGWDGKITAYAYDAAGQLSQQTEYGCLKDTDRRNGPHPGRTALPEIWHIHHFTRNLLGQLVEKTSRKIEKDGSRHKDHGAVRTRFDYDPAGNMGSHRLIRARNRHSSLEYTYDALGRITRETLTHNGRQTGIAYQYDANGNRLQTTLPDGQQISTLYYGSGHLHHIALDGQTIADIERDRLHRETQRTQGTLVSRFDYDPMGRLQRQSAERQGTPHPSPLVERRYRYDKAGNLIGSADLRSGTTHYTYDQLGRILEAANAGRNTKEKFAFDPAGNILDELARNAREGSLYRPVGNRIAEFNGTRYQYDPLGNLIYRELPDGESQLFEYDTENQLIRAKLYKPDGEVQQWQYAYDPFGRRISKERIDKGSLHSTDPKRTVFIWDGSRIVQEYNYKGVYTYFYTDQDSYEPLAHVFYNNKDEKLYLSYYHTDQIGSPREQTDQFGNLLWTGEYDAWGKLTAENKICPNAHQPFRLQNQYFDQETGLHYNLFRDYDPNCGRFVNQDPIKLVGGDNFYQFAPNTTGWVDWLGLKGLRDILMGRTPRKNSKTGREIIERMRKQGLIRGRGKNTMYKSKTDGKWYPLHTADMCHKRDAVTWWNNYGRYFGAKSKPVRKFMLDSRNYILDHYSHTVSAFAQLPALLTDRLLCIFSAISDRLVSPPVI